MADKTLSLVIKTSNDGLGAIDQLLDKLDAAGVETTELRDQAKAAADQLAGVKLQQDALDSFRALGAETRTLSRDLDAATASIDQTAAKLNSAQLASARFARSEQEKRAAIAETKAALASMQQELEQLRGTTDKAARTSNDYKTSVKQAEQTIQALRSELAQQNAALKITVGEKRSATAAERELTQAMEREIAAAGRLSSTLGNKRAAMDAHRKTLQGVGLDTQHLADAEFKLDKQARQARDAVVGLATAVNNAGRAAAESAGHNEKLRTTGEGVADMARRLALSLAGAFTFRELVTAAADMEKLQVGLTAVAGSSENARAQLEYIRQLSNRIGADVIKTGEAWLGFQAAIKGTAVEGELGREVFEAVATSMAKAGKSSAETSNALVALQQIAGKGTVSMEELRGQLGEALPGALQAAAKGMGLTTQQLIQMVENGQVAAQDLFPALTKGLNDLYGGAPAAQTLSQEIANIKNAFVEMAQNLGESGGLSALKVGAEAAQAAIVMLDAALVAAGKSIGVMIGALVTMDFSQVKTMLAEIQAEAESKLLKAAQHNTTLRNALKAVGDESARTALAQQEAAAATSKTAQAASAVAPSYLALVAAYGDVRKELLAQIELADKNVAAVKARGEAAVAEAKLLGDEAGLHKAIGQAAADEAVALADLAQKRQTDVDVLRAELENRRVLLRTTGDYSAERRKEVADLEQLIQKKQIEADTTRGQAAAAQANARAKGEEAQAAQAVLRAAQSATTARVADAKVSLSLLETQKALAGQSEQLAQLMGNEEAARNFRIEQLQIDIKITLAKAEVQRAEAQGSIAVAEATMNELRVKGELTAVKEAELNASIKLAQAKLKEADAIQQSSRVTEQAISNLRNFGSETRNAAGQNEGATNKIRQGWDGVAGSIDRATGSLNRFNSTPKGNGGSADNRFQKGRFSSNGEELGDGVVEIGSGGAQFQNKDGMSSDAKGNVIGMMESQESLDRRVAKLFGEQFIGNKDAIEAANLKLKLDQIGKYGTSNLPGQNEWQTSVRESYDRLVQKLSGGGAVAGANNSAPGTGGGNNYVVNVTIDGRKRSINTKDQASQQALQDLVRELGDASRRAA